MLRSEFAGDRGFLERFRTEARNSASLSHPNIAQLFDYGEQDGSGFLVMELVVGEPLSDLLEREPVLPTRRLLPILAQTARGLHAAHIAGVVHRDVKPGNILLGRGGRVKITDFGVSLARNQVTMTATGMVMGTAQYLSPEQAVGQPGDAAVRPVLARDHRVRGARRAPAVHRPDRRRHRGRAREQPRAAAARRAWTSRWPTSSLRLLSKEPSARPAVGRGARRAARQAGAAHAAERRARCWSSSRARTPDTSRRPRRRIAPPRPRRRPYPPRRTRRLEEPATPRRSRTAPPTTGAPVGRAGGRWPSWWRSCSCSSALLGRRPRRRMLDQRRTDPPATVLVQRRRLIGHAPPTSVPSWRAFGCDDRPERRAVHAHAADRTASTEAKDA